MSNEKEVLSSEIEERFSNFDPTKPLIINAAEVEGLENLVGRFLFKRPTIKNQIDIGIKYAELTQGKNLDDINNSLAMMLATFEQVCKEKPNGFSFEECENVDAVLYIYVRYIEWLNFFREKLSRDKRQSS